MNLYFCTFFLLAFLFIAINADLGDECIDIDNNPGTCINLKQCPKLLNLLIKSTTSLPEHLGAIAIIQKSTCGYSQQDPYVCCSHVNPDIKDKIPPKNSTFQSGQQGPPSTGAIHPVSDLPTTFIPTPMSSPASTTAEAKITTQLPTTATSVLTSVASSTIQITPGEDVYPKIDDHKDEKLKLLPEDCGRVVTFKFFYGNLTELDDFPWTTLVEYNTPSGKRFACGGALISERYVLTAAHCVSGLKPSWKVIGVRFGEYDISTDIDCQPDGHSDVFCAEKPLNVAVEEIIAHSGFQPENPNRPHDIALLRLAEKVSFTDFIKPICLPLVQPIPQRYYTSGWGKNIGRNGTALKYMSYLTLVNQKICSDKYSRENITISPNQTCAGILSTEKSCIGDEGGPLMGIEERADYMKRVTTFGVLSMTRPSASTCDYDWPGVYTKVLDYMPWILSQLKE